MCDEDTEAGGGFNRSEPFIEPMEQVQNKGKSPSVNGNY